MHNSLHLNSQKLNCCHVPNKGNSWTVKFVFDIVVPIYLFLLFRVNKETTDKILFICLLIIFLTFRHFTMSF